MQTHQELDDSMGTGLEGDQKSASVPDISSLGPGAYGLGPSDSVTNVPAYMERMTTDISALKKQYAKLRQRQTQAHIILTTASAKKQAVKTRPMMPMIETPTAVNHLFLAKQGLKGRNRFVAAGPRIADMYPITSPLGTSSTQTPVQPQAKVETTSKWGQKPWKTSQQQKSQPQKQISSKKLPDSNLDSNSHHQADGETKLNRNSEVRSSPGKKESHSANIVRETVEDLTKVEGDTTDCNDSGLGNSLSSPVHSFSSPECSPQHEGACVESQVMESFPEVKLDHFYKETAAIWSDGPEDVGEANNCGPDETGAETSVIVADKLKHEADANVMTDSKAEEVDVGSGVGDKITVAAEMNIERRTNEEEIDSTERTDANIEAIVRECDADQSLQDTIPKCYSADESDNCMQSEMSRQLSEPTVASVHSKSRWRSNPSVMSGSGSDGENFPEVFSSDMANMSHSQSFQQYYATKRNLSDSGSLLTAQLQKSNMSKKSFNPFPVKHLNQNRAKTGIKLGLYKQSTLEEYERNLKVHPSVWTK